MMFKVVMDKVSLSLGFINEAPPHEVVWGSAGISPPFLTSALDEGEWSASRPCNYGNKICHEMKSTVSF
jgi:hypothetical protein